MAWGLMVLGNAPFTKIVSALAPVQRRLAREVNAIVLPVANCVLIEALRLNSRNEGKTTTVVKTRTLVRTKKL